jgi:hypothetical protein
MSLYIIENINDLSIADRIEILQIIYNSPIRNKIKEKGNGVEIKISDIPEPFIIIIENMIKSKLESHSINF